MELQTQLTTTLPLKPHKQTAEKLLLPLLQVLLLLLLQLPPPLQVLPLPAGNEWNSRHSQLTTTLPLNPHKQTAATTSTTTTTTTTTTT